MGNHVFLQLQHFLLSRFGPLFRKRKSLLQALILIGQLYAAFHPFLGLLFVKLCLILAVLHLFISNSVSGHLRVLSANSTEYLTWPVHGSLAMLSIKS